MSRDYVLEPFNAGIQLQIDYARELNEQQLAAVTAAPGPALVIAGAGSGKTRTLIYRVAYLLEQGIPPERIVLLTFTNKAAREMMRRVGELLGRDLPALWGGTFHAIGNRILRLHARELGYQRDFTILDSEDSRHLLSACIAAVRPDPTVTRFPKSEVVGDVLSMAVNTGLPLTTLLETRYPHFQDLAGPLAEVRDAYAKRKLENQAMDFDDLLLLWLRLMREHPDIAERYQRRFQFVLVDEYQDTNHLQSAVVDLLAARHHNLMVVGDDAQSIYAWRGANYDNILKFPERYPEAKVFKIEINYRSTPEILRAANAAIAMNVRQFRKELAAARKSGVKPIVVACLDSSQQAAFVAQRVLQLREEGADLNQMAVLYRSHFHALELQLELTRRNIPFSITSGIRFFEQAHIKDVTAFLKLLVNPRDELSFKRLAQLLPGIGGIGAEKLWREFHAHRDSAAVRASAEPIAHALQLCAARVPKKAAVAWAQFVATVAQLEAKSVRDSASAMIRLVLEAGYADHLRASFENAESRLEDLAQLAAYAQQFNGLEDFLSQLALQTNLEAEEEPRRGESDERLRLSTIHQAKGLEFDVVFLIMLGEGLFPSARAEESPDTMEEERRLAYVAITRARNELYLTYPLERILPGSGGNFLVVPSRFIREIPEDLREEWNLRTYA